MSRSTVRHVMPFPALVGQEQLKLTLKMLAVNPRLGGVLIRGEKGTAKSTAAHALARLLPPVLVNRGCPFGCPSERPVVWCTQCRDAAPRDTTLRPPPFETLPLGITEDQLLGTVDLEHALREGKQRFAPGLLARVNQGVLYVDEVNLLPDHIVDLLLDAAAMGVNVVAREGVTVTHPTEFMLVGTMNPEEGSLRPQLLDRFGLCVDIEALTDIGQRANIIERRLDFEADPEGFGAAWEKEESALADQLVSARRLLSGLKTDRLWYLVAANLAVKFGVDGHRADVLLVKAAATIAALDGRDAIADGDMERAATVVMPHRLRRQPLDVEGMTPGDLAERAREIVREGPEKKVRRRRD